jgi:hypothetical protein
MPEAVASVVVDRAIGLLTMFVFGAVAYWLTDLSSIQALHPQTLQGMKVVCWFATAISLAGIVGLGLLMAFPNFDRWPVVRSLKSIPKIGPLLERLIQVVVIYRGNKPQMFCALLNSMSVNALLAISIFAIAHGISDTHPSLMQHMLISPVVMVGNAAPLPGGLGGMEISLDLMYKALSQSDAPAEHGFIVALGYRVVLLAIAAIGVVLYFLQRPSVPQSFSMEAQPLTKAT